ncbi:hypothetical protein [Azospirillum doebereinerae]
MIGTLLMFLGKGKKLHFDEFVCGFLEQALLDEINQEAGTHVSSKPTAGGVVETLFNTSGPKRTRPKLSKPKRRGSPRLKRLLANNRISRQRKLRMISGIEDPLIDICKFHKTKSKMYSLHKIKSTDVSIKDELFVMMATSLSWKDAIDVSEEIERSLEEIRQYIDGLTEAEAVKILGVCRELRNRENIPGL